MKVKYWKTRKMNFQWSGIKASVRDMLGLIRLPTKSDLTWSHFKGVGESWIESCVRPFTTTFSFLIIPLQAPSNKLRSTPCLQRGKCCRRKSRWNQAIHLKSPTRWALECQISMYNPFIFFFFSQWHLGSLVLQSVSNDFCIVKP